MDNFKKILDLDGSTSEHAIRSGDTGQRIPCFNSGQLITTLMSNMCVISVFLCSQTSWKVWDWTLVALWCGRTCERASGRVVYGHVITKISGMGRFTYPWCSRASLLWTRLSFSVATSSPGRFSLALEVGREKLGKSALGTRLDVVSVCSSSLFRPGTHCCPAKNHYFNK